MLAQRILSNAWQAKTVQALFRETCGNVSERTAIIHGNEKISFGQLLDRVDRLSMALLGLGVEPGDRVAMLPISCPEFVYTYFAALQVGAVVNPLNLLWGEIEFAGILPRNDPKVIVTVDENLGRDYVALLRTAIGDLCVENHAVSSANVPALTHLVSLSRQGKAHEGFVDFHRLMAEADTGLGQRLDQRIADAESNDIQFMCQTSGSTGLSKSGLWTHITPLATAHFMVRALHYDPADRLINMAPFFHNSGMAAINVALAYTGTPLLLMDNFHPKAALEMIHLHKATATFGFDAHWQALHLGLQAAGDGIDFTLYKALVAVMPQTYDLIVDRICRSPNPIIASLYAQTENGPLVSLVEPECLSRDLRKYTQGRPLPGVEVTIKEIETGRPLPAGSQGEICYKSPFFFAGYYKQEEETAKQFDAEGYWHSGDFGTFDGGYLRFLGRLGGVVKSGGENVSVAYVTSLLMDLFADDFEDVQTIGVPDPYWGTKIVSWVRMKAGKRLATTEAIRKACKGKMAEYEIPKAFLEWTGPWPVTEVGKLRTEDLEKEARNRTTGEK